MSAANSQADDLKLELVEKSLQKLGLVSLERWRLRVILLMHPTVRGLQQATRGDGHKLKHKKFHLNVRKSVFNALMLFNAYA